MLTERSRKPVSWRAKAVMGKSVADRRAARLAKDLLPDGRLLEVGREAALDVPEPLLLEGEGGVVRQAVEVDEGVDGRVLLADRAQALAEGLVHHADVVRHLDQALEVPVR